MIYAYPTAAAVLFLYLGAKAYRDKRRGCPVNAGELVQLFLVMVPFVFAAVLLVLVLLQAGINSAGR